MEKQARQEPSQEDEESRQATKDIAASPKKADAAGASAPPAGDHDLDFPVVGIGASAGGLRVFATFFDNLPPDSGMAFVLVQHLSASYESMLDDIIGRHTNMEVSEIEDGTKVEVNHVYIIPPGKDLALLHGALHLIEPTDQRGPRLPIDYFFRSLARDQHERAICIVLSGTASDGTLGVKAVKQEGGMVMAQDPETAEYDGMPRSAIGTGLVDYVLPTAEMPQQLISYVEHAFGPDEKRVAVPGPRRGTALQKVFVLLRDHVGHDFSYYKKSTVHRRLERRMAVNQIKEVNDYVRFLRQNPREIEALFRELLISVTNFFRDPEAFQALEEEVIPRLLESRDERAVRVWVPGCATGEEAYSIAILLQEQMAMMRKSYDVQIFATDIDSGAIETARAGIYPDGIAADVSPERLARFFTQENSAYHINKIIRDMLVFAEQNVTKDPPFSRIGLISCRNLLIYLEPQLQKKILPLFHYALRPGGFLFLGTSESIGEFTDLFGTVDSKQRIFQRKDTADAQRSLMAFSTPPHLRATEPSGALETRDGDKRIGFREIAERLLLEHHTPSCAVVNESGEVRYFHGRTGKYLEPAPGEATLNVLRMARPGLLPQLATAIRKALNQKQPIRYRDVQVKTNDTYHMIDLTVRPVMDPPSMRDLLLVVFEDLAPEEQLASVEEPSEPVEDRDRHIAHLERELRAKDEYLQTTVEELETSNEELRSTNEELQSSNEELQSTVEELETAKEETQSVNEELRTVNAELEQKVDELTQANNDIRNLLAGTGIGTIFLDEQLNIQRFTPAAADVMNLIQTDVGRPVSHITSRLANYEELARDAKGVLETLTPQDREVQTRAGDWYLLRIRPYRTLQNVISGLVLTFTDITDLKRAEQEIKAARNYAQSIVETVREPLLILNADLEVISANRSFYETFGEVPEETEGELLYNLGSEQWDIPELRELLEEILPQETVLSDYQVEQEFSDRGPRRMMLNARELHRPELEERLILLAIEDVSGSASHD